MAAILTTMLSSLAACSNRAGDCHDNGNCGGAHPAESTSSAGGHGGASASTGSGGGPDCTGDPADANIDEACAIFVEHDATGAAGTRAAPLGDLDKAIELASKSGKRVYACGDFDGPLAPTSAFDLWGGFKCKGGGWTWSGDERSKLGAPDDQVPLVADVAGVVGIHTFSITAGSASAPVARRSPSSSESKPRRRSIAAISMRGSAARAGRPPVRRGPAPWPCRRSPDRSPAAAPPSLKEPPSPAPTGPS